MEELTTIQQEMLDVIDAKLKKVNKVLKKAEPWIIERDRLMQMRRVLLSEKGTTSGGGAKARLTMEEVITAMRALGGKATAPQIADKLGLDPTVVRSHLHRNKDTRYKQLNGDWVLVEEDDEEEDD